MTRLLVVSAVALAAFTFSLPAPAQAQSKADGIRNVETTDFSARRRHWRHRHYVWPFFAGAALAAIAAPRYHYYPRYYYPRYYYRPAYYPYYPRYRYYRRPGVSISFGFGPRWWW